MPSFSIPVKATNMANLPFDPSDGICVLPSSMVSSTRPGSLRAKPIHRYTVSFADFMVDDFLQEKVGDTTKEGIKIARGESPEFEVRYSLGVDLRNGPISTGEALRPLFQ